jgi:hypothetical protein
VDPTNASGLKTPSYRIKNARSFGDQPPALPDEGKSGAKGQAEGSIWSFLRKLSPSMTAVSA